MNENYKHPEIPKHVKKGDILKGMYLFKEFRNKVYGEARKIHVTRFPYNHFLYPEILNEE